MKKLVSDDEPNKNSNKIQFLKILLIILFWETIIMFGLEQLRIESHALEILIDSVSLTFLAGISIWRFVYVPTTKKITEKHELSENLCHELIDGMGKISMIAIIDKNRNIVFANELFLNSTGYSKDEAVGNSIKIMRSNYHPAEFYDQVWQTINDGKTWAGEIRNKKKDGEPIWTKTFIMPIRNQAGNFVVFQFDITEEKLFHEAMLQEQLKTIHIDRLAVLGEMAGGISHEINNPLTAITGMLTMTEQFIKKGDFTNKEITDKELTRISKIQTHAFRIKRIVDALKEFTRNGENSEIRETTNLQHIIDVIHDLNYEKLLGKGITFTTDIKDFNLKCNIAQIEEVVATLVNNSVDAIDELESRWIKICTATNGDYLDISVIDSGNGIPDSIALKLMQPFFTTKEVGKGTGLGLSIAKSIIENHGGKLFIDTNSANTKFVVRLPLTDNPLLDLLDANQAIEAHLAWRQKLLAVINKNSELPNTDVVGADDKCELGRWIKKVESSFEKNPVFKEMRKAHTEFHKCVARTIIEFKNGNTNTSEMLVGSGSEFDILSNKVIACLKKLKEYSSSGDEIKSGESSISKPA
jgi:PAS domain S-box-containing protein